MYIYMYTNIEFINVKEAGLSRASEVCEAKVCEVACRVISPESVKEGNFDAVLVVV